MLILSLDERYTVRAYQMDSYWRHILDAALFCCVYLSSCHYYYVTLGLTYVLILLMRLYVGYCSDVVVGYCCMMTISLTSMNHSSGDYDSSFFHNSYSLHTYDDDDDDNCLVHHDTVENDDIDCNLLNPHSSWIWYHFFWSVPYQLRQEEIVGCLSLTVYMIYESAQNIWLTE